MSTYFTCSTAVMFICFCLLKNWSHNFFSSQGSRWFTGTSRFHCKNSSRFKTRNHWPKIWQRKAFNCPSAIIAAKTLLLPWKIFIDRRDLKTFIYANYYFLHKWLKFDFFLFLRSKNRLICKLYENNVVEILVVGFVQNVCSTITRLV